MQDQHTTKTKRCSRCGIEKPATNEYFIRHKRSRDGLGYRCKACANAWYAAYRSEKRTRLAHKQRAYHAAHKEQVSDRKRTYYAENREQINRQHRIYRMAHREQEKIRTMRRLVRKRNAEGTITVQDVAVQHKRQKGRCFWCGVKVGNAYHVDHIIPLSRGGSNGPDNIVIACQPCNQSKHNKLPHEWPRGGRLL